MDQKDIRKVIETIDNKEEKGEYIGIFTTIAQSLEVKTTKRTQP